MIRDLQPKPVIKRLRRGERIAIKRSAALVKLWQLAESYQMPINSLMRALGLQPSQFMAQQEAMLTIFGGALIDLLGPEIELNAQAVPADAAEPTPRLWVYQATGARLWAAIPASEAACRLSYPVQSIWTAMQRGHLTAVKVGREWLVSLVEVERIEAYFRQTGETRVPWKRLRKEPEAT